MDSRLFYEFFVILIIFYIHNNGGGCSAQDLPADPEFLAPIKNITAPIGSNVDFSCTIKNLGASRIMWYRRPSTNGRKEELLGVNNLKITKSTKISLSVLPSAGGVTQSILYIFNVDVSDNAIYTCGVDTEPMMTMHGSLEAAAKEEMPTTIPTTNSPSEFETVEVPAEPKSGLFCIDVGKLWKQAKSSTQKFLSLIWTEINSLFR